MAMKQLSRLLTSIGRCCGKFALPILVLVLAASLRLWDLDGRGMENLDGGKFYWFLNGRLSNHDLSLWGKPGETTYMWGRQSYFLALLAESLFIQRTVYAMLLHNAICGVLAVALLMWALERYVKKGVGIFGGLLLAVSPMPIYYTRHLKDFGHTFFFLLLGMVLISAAWRSRRVSHFFIAGLMLGVGTTANYGSIPAVFAIVLTAALIHIYDALKREITPCHTFRSLCCFGIGLALVPLAFEAFYPIISHYFPFWEMPKGWGYFKGFNTHRAVFAGNLGDGFLYKALGLPFYIDLFRKEGWWIAYPAALGLVLAPFRRAYRTRHVLLFAAVLIIPIMLYSVSTSIGDLARNAWPSYSGFVVFAAIGWYELVSWLTSLVHRGWNAIPRTALSTTATLVIVSVIAVCAVPAVRLATIGRSAAEQIHRFIKVDRACVTEAKKLTWHWQWYYFRDWRRLSCKTWSDVAERFLRDRVEYLVVLPKMFVDWDKNELAQYDGAPTLVAYNYPANRRKGRKALLFHLHDPDILTDKLGLETIAKFDVPDTIVPEVCTRSTLQKTIEQSATHYDFQTEQDGIFEVRGHVDLDEPGELLVLAVGTPDNPVKFYLEVLPAQLPNIVLNGRHALTSLQTCFLVREQRDVRVSLAYIRSPYADAGATSPPTITDFALVEYASNVQAATPRYRLAPSVDRTAFHSEILSRFSDSYLEKLRGGSVLSDRWYRFNTKDKARAYLAVGAPVQDRKSQKTKLAYGSTRGYRPGTPEAPIVTIDSWKGPTSSPVGFAHRVKPGQYRPGAVYRVSFSGWTNLFMEGQVAVVFHPTGKRSDEQWVKGRSFWRSSWQKYSFDFMAPPDGSIPFSIVVKEARPGHSKGLIQVSDISVRELDGPVPKLRFWRTHPVPMVVPRDQVNFAELAALRHTQEGKE